MSIIKSILGRREPVVEYRTVDGGHPAPYPDMTDEQLYNYEITFNVPQKTFDKPPRSVEPATTMHKSERSMRYSGKRFDTQTPDEHVATEPSRDDAANDARRAPQPAAPAHTTMPALDFSRPVRTITTKQPVEILTTRARHPVYPVHGYIGEDNIVTVFTLDGQLSENGPRFLENAPEKYQLYVNIYPNRDAGGKDRFVLTQHASKEEADAMARAERIACGKLQFDL